MKKLLMLFVLALSPVAVRAAENPDKYPSVGLTYSQTYLRDGKGGSFAGARPTILDVRIPATSNVTLGFHGGPTTFSTSSNEVRSGYTLGFSARVYLPFRIVRD